MDYADKGVPDSFRTLVPPLRISAVNRAFKTLKAIAKSGARPVPGNEDTKLGFRWSLLQRRGQNLSSVGTYSWVKRS